MKNIDRTKSDVRRGETSTQHHMHTNHEIHIINLNLYEMLSDNVVKNGTQQI